MVSSFPKFGLCESTHSKGLELAALLRRNAVMHPALRISFSVMVRQIAVLGVEVSANEVGPI
ncbi:hypothetical protein A7P25_22040 [Achromobacter xylosoxidans]|nr:hypothetical protein A7P25_22040 [Achromobacter xylosoxidans]